MKIYFPVYILHALLVLHDEIKSPMRKFMTLHAWSLLCALGSLGCNPDIDPGLNKMI